MKKLALNLLSALVVFSAVFTMQSCSDNTKLLHYELSLSSGAVEVTIPPSNDTSNTNKMATGMTHINIDSIVRSRTSGRAGVKNIGSVRLNSVTLTLVNGTTANNFANFQSGFTSFYSNSNGMPYIVVIPNIRDLMATTLSIPGDPNVELQGYMRGDTFYWSVGGKLRRPITASLVCRIEFTFDMSVYG